MSDTTTPAWLSAVQSAIKDGRKIEVQIDNDSIVINDVTDVPHEDDGRWADAQFDPYVPMCAGLDIHPSEALADLLRAMGVAAGPI